MLGTQREEAWSSAEAGQGGSTEKQSIRPLELGPSPFQMKRKREYPKGKKQQIQRQGGMKGQRKKWFLLAAGRWMGAKLDQL